MTVLGERPHSIFIPTWRTAFHGSPPIDFYHLSPFDGKNIMFMDKIQKIKKKSFLRERTIGLIEWLAEHHELSARHCFGVAFIASELGKKYFSYYNDLGIDPNPILKKIFIGGLLHDIGKVGIDLEILDREGPLTPVEKEKVKQHGLIGARILFELGLQDFAYFNEEHHIGHNGICQWTTAQLMGRHPLTEIISMADLIDASLDEARKYKRTITLPQLINIIHKNTKKGVFSKKLEKVLLELIKEERPSGLLFSKYAPLNDLLETIPIN